VHAELSFLGFLRPWEQVIMRREDVAQIMCPPDRARQKLVRPFVVLPLMGPTKSSPDEAAGIVVCWQTRGGIRVGEHVQALLRMCHEDGQPCGPLLTQGDDTRRWTQTHALHRVVRPTLDKMVRATGDPRRTDAGARALTLNAFRRGGNSHARDRGAERWQCTAHGRWEGHWEKRDSLAMTDLYDAAGTDQKLVVTSMMG
jgi:hypothetical protein